jgi:tRNA/rRNA methyltransferase
VRVVLSHPSHPGNIGSVARAMKTMGLSQLVLVRPKRYPDPQAEALSSNARDVLDAARVVDTLEEALASTVMAVATISHGYELTPEVMTARSAARQVIDAAGQADVALVFGTEANGLSVEEVGRCTLAAHIPSNPEYTSLNLAAAVQIFCYELRLAALEDPLPVLDAGEPATLDDIEQLHRHLEQAMVATGFFDPANPKRLLPRLRRLVARARLEKEEVRILRGLLRTMARTDPTKP